MADHFKVNSSGVITFAGAYNPDWISNLNISIQTTTDSNDTIRIDGYGNAALSSTNPGYVTIAQATGGATGNYSITANVDIKLTGAHWGHGTKGDITGKLLYIYAINDNNNAVKWGVSDQPNIRNILNTDSSTTQTNIDASGDMLVNSALTAGTWGCQRIGWFRANFDDTGGASEDLWTIQTGNDDLGIHVFASYPNSSVVAKYNSNAGNTITKATLEILDFEDQVFDSNSAVTTGASWKFTAPETGYYAVSVQVLFDGTAAWVAGTVLYMHLYKNGVFDSLLDYQEIEANGTFTKGVGGSTLVSLNTSDYIDARIYHNEASDEDLNGNAANNHISIYKI